MPYIFLGEACHGVGKTFVLEAGVLLWFHECIIPRAGESHVVQSTAPTSTQVRDLLWKDVRTHIEQAVERGFKIGRGILPSDPRINKRGNYFAVGTTTNDNGGKGAERAQGQHNTYHLWLFDEAEGVPPFMYNGIKRQLTGCRVRLWVLMANPKTRTSRFQRMKTQLGAVSYRLSLLDFPNVVRGEEVVPGGTSRETFNGWLFDYEDFGAHPIEAPDPDHHDFQTAWEIEGPDGRTYPAGQWWRPQRGFLYGALGIPPAEGDGDTLISSAAYEAALKRAPRPKTGDLARVGVDVARFGKDAGKIYLDLDGNVTLEATIQRGDTHAYLDAIRKAARKAHAAGYRRLSVRVDAGYGGGAIDNTRVDGDLLDLFGDGLKVHEVHFGGTPHDPLKYADRSTELYGHAALVMPSLSIRAAGKNLEEDLAGRKFKLVVRNIENVRREVRRIETKDEFRKRYAGRSPDDGDGFTLATAPEFVFEKPEEDLGLYVG